MLDNTEGTIEKDIPEKLVTQGAQDTGQISAREYRRGNKKDNLQKQATQGTQDTEQNKCDRIPKGQ